MLITDLGVGVFSSLNAYGTEILNDGSVNKLRELNFDHNLKRINIVHVEEMSQKRIGAPLMLSLL